MLHSRKSYELSLTCLIGRAVSLVFRSKVHSATWRAEVKCRQVQRAGGVVVNVRQPRTDLQPIAGDNGTSAEGGMTGLYNEMTYFNAEPQGSDIDFMLKYYDNWGDPSTYPHMSAGWAVAFDSPFTWTKQVASNYGGTRNALVVHWPDRIKAKGEIRSQWHHVIDVAPTILEAAGLPQPRIVNGVPQPPIEGTSMVYTWDYPKAPSQHTTQYFEMFGNRGIYFDGWFAGTVHMKPWASPEARFP